MTSVPDQITRAWTRSRTLNEILEEGSPEPGEPRSSRALQDWVRAYSPGDESALLRRLAWDGIEPVRAAAALEGRLTVPGPDDAFRRDVEALIELCAEPASPEPELESIPFVHLWEPFVRMAERRLAAVHEHQTSLLEPAAWIDLRRNLAAHVAWCGTPSAWTAFEEARAKHGMGYDAFCQAIRSNPLDFFSDHAALLRRLLLLARQWADSTAELLDRIEADLDTISAMLGSVPTPVAGIRPGVSDRHHGGRQVAILTTASGAKLVYKPRASHSLGRFNDLLRWYATIDPALAPKAIEVIERDSYAWIEFVEQADLDSSDAVVAYHRRAGALIFFAWLLGGSDLHMDNIVASPRSPVIVDTEVFVRPTFSRSASSGAMQAARDRISSSVVGTGMLSFPQQDESGGVFDIGGLVGTGGYMSPPRRSWLNVNSDSMRFTEERKEVPPMENVVRHRGEIVNAGEYVNELIDGFTVAFEQTLAHRDEILADDGPLEGFRGAETRVLFRPSNQYASLLQLLISPTCSRTGTMTSLYIESLGRPFTRLEAPPGLWPLVGQERESLEQLDIPLFTISCGATEIPTGSGDPIRGLIDQSGVETLHSRVRALEVSDLHEQTRLIAATLVSARSHIEDEDETPLTSFHSPDPSAISAAIKTIADTLVDNAVTGDDGVATWIAPEYVKIDSLADSGATYYLYSGVTGIAIFLAAYSRATGNGDAGTIARAAWRPLEALLESDDIERVRDHLRLGIANGIGSIVYASVLASQLSGDESLLGIARGFAELLADERLAKETDLDIEGGVAGAALALQRLYLATGEEEWLLRASRAAGRLLAESTLSDDGRSWRSDSTAPPLAGMAHGAAGMGLTLASIGRSTGDAALMRAAMEAFAWERSIFDDSLGNWPVRTGDGRSINMVAWCHGAPGIGLSRIGARLADPDLECDLETAARATRASGISSVDHVCCGNSGRIDFLIEAAAALDDSLILEEARHRAGAMVSRAAFKGGFALTDSNDPQTFRPGFFRGLAGIGYTLLRSIEPGSLPSLTRFEIKGEENS